MFYVINDIEPSNAMEYQNQLMSVLKVRKVCYLSHLNFNIYILLALSLL